MGTLPFLIITGAAMLILLFQPDNDTILVMVMAGSMMYFMSGANLKHVLLVMIMGIIAAGGVFATRPYVRDRVMTFINPAADPLASGYQIQQSLIAIGSGGFWGRGFGQSVQKFNFLPEPISDSIFAVAAEEFGFVGSVLLVTLFIALLIKGFRVALNARDSFGGLLVLGLVILIAGQSFINIASMLGIFPLSGLPLLFVSHGGSALFFTLFASGIILNVSRFQRKKSS
jgi:cell division protein FtsW